jgi:hypothetical protein
VPKAVLYGADEIGVLEHEDDGLGGQVPSVSAKNPFDELAGFNAPVPGDVPLHAVHAAPARETSLLFASEQASERMTVLPPLKQPHSTTSPTTDGGTLRILSARRSCWSAVDE